MDRPTKLLAATDAASSRLLTVVGIVVVIAGLYFGRQVLIPFALATVLAFLLTPVVRLLEKCRLGRVPSVGVVLIVCFALASITAWGVTTRLMDIMADGRLSFAPGCKEGNSQVPSLDRINFRGLFGPC